MPRTTDPRSERHSSSRTTRPPVAARLAARPAPRPASASPDDEEPRPPADPRSRLIGVAVIGAAAVVAIVMTVGIFLPALGEIAGGAPRFADPAALPATILVCGREYSPAGGVAQTLADVRAQDGRDPVVVSAEADAGCPADACVEGGLCLPIVYVRSPDSRYIAYALAGDEP